MAADSDFVASHLQTLSAHNSDVNCVAFSTDNKLASCSGDKAVRIWSTSDFTELPCSPLLGHSYTVHYCAFSPFGTNIASCSTDGKAIVWDVKTGQKIITFQHASQNSIRVCRFSSNSSYLVTGSDDDKLCLWNLKSKQLVRAYPGHDGSVVACAFTPDSNFIVSGCNNGNIKAWDVQYGQMKQLAYILDGHDLGVTCCDFSPTFGTAANHRQDGQVRFLLVTGGQDNLLKLWYFCGMLGYPSVNIELKQELVGHLETVNACCFSSSGEYIASGSSDKTCRIWNAATGAPIHAIEGHSRYVTSCAFSSDNKMIATGSNDRMVMVWKLTTVDQMMDAVNPNDVETSTDSGDIASKLARLNSKPLRNWTKDDVCVWLVSIDMGEYCKNFQDNEIDGAEMVGVSHDMLISLGVNALGHRNKILRAKQTMIGSTQLKVPSAPPDSSGIPDEYLCPITHEVMKDPVIAEDGYTYERSAIESWFGQGKTRSPMIQSHLKSTNLTPNRSLKVLIQRYLNS